MKADPAEYELITPGSLQEALGLIAQEPGKWLPIAGGTDVMVQFAAGTLGSRKLLSIWNLPELRRIEILPDELRIGAGATYTDIRRHEVAGREFPLLAQAASWTGGIANQNRGTLGGNIVNASPAADSLPALLAYEAELILISARGERRMRYVDFHAGYKRMQLEPNELIRAICLPRKYSGYASHARKVGARNAQAISKVCIAAIARVERGEVVDVRIALGSVAPVPIRLRETERLLGGTKLDAAAMALARKTAVAETRPIDDIRSTARYRAAVVGNVVGEFVEKLVASLGQTGALERWNLLSAAEAEEEILACCGSRAWAQGMVERRPFAIEAEILKAASEIWRGLDERDWGEAFHSHPRIGEQRAEQPSHARSAVWSEEEQKRVGLETDAVKAELAEANREYERRFGRIFIICATGKSGAEILEILRRRLRNDAQTELREAAEQQRQIAEIRLKKWLAQ